MRTFLTSLLVLSSLLSIGQSDFHCTLADSAITLVDHNIKYDSKYSIIIYPNGDVDPYQGVCSDVIIRAYRKLGVDLQKEVHEDMKSNFMEYPKKWGLRRTDRNIDHRRVPNLMRFFERKNASLKITKDVANFKPGDVISWDLDDGRPHIGIVVNRKTSCGARYLMLHNVGEGQVLDDCLFRYKITGHYRYIK